MYSFQTCDFLGGSPWSRRRIKHFVCLCFCSAKLKLCKLKLVWYRQFYRTHTHTRTYAYTRAHSPRLRRRTDRSARVVCNPLRSPLTGSRRRRRRQGRCRSRCSRQRRHRRQRGLATGASSSDSRCTTWGNAWRPRAAGRRTSRPPGGQRDR